MKNINVLYRKSAIVVSRYSKLSGLVLFVLLAGLVRFISFPTHYSSEWFWLDAGWFLALQEQLQYGQLLGRDIYFTYGPLSQLIAYLGIFLRDNPNPVVGYGTTMFMFSFVAPSVMLVVSIMMIREINLFSAIFIFVIFFLLPGSLSLRSQMLLFNAILFAYSLAQPSVKRRILAVISGLSWFAGQMIATDTGIFSLMTAVTFTSFMVIISFIRRLAPKINLLSSRVYLESFLVGFSVFVFLNLILEFYYLSTSPYYSFFDNIRYNVAIARGYSLTMGVPWSADFSFTIILFAIVLFNIIGLLLTFRRDDIQIDSFCIKFAILISGLILLRGSVTRSDIGHILHAFSIQYFLIILVVLTISSVQMKHVGMVLLVFLVLSYPFPGARFAEVNRFLEVVGSSSLRERIQEVRAAKADTRGLAPDELLRALDSSKKIVNFPFANYITMALGLRTFAPILQTYAAHTQNLQEFYINRIDAVRSDVEVIYAISEFSADGAAVDGVQNVTRVPIIAEYLVEHFRLKYPIAFRYALYVLEPREQPVELQRAPISFSSDANDKEIVISVTSSPEMCTYAELEMVIDYPWYSFAGRPNSLIVAFERNGVTTVTSGLVAIESGKPFSTFFYLGEPFAYSQVFASYPHRAILGVFDRVVIRPAPATLFTVNPTNVRITELNCVNVPLQQQDNASPYLLAAGQSLNLWERSWLPVGRFPGAVSRVPDGLFIHSGWYVDLGPYAVPPGVCFTAVASFDPEVAGKPEADGAEFVVTILSDSQQTFSKTVALMPGETAMLQAPVPDDAPFWVRLETRPRGNGAWDWAIWQTPRLAPCEQD